MRVISEEITWEYDETESLKIPYDRYKDYFYTRNIDCPIISYSLSWSIDSSHFKKISIASLDSKNDISLIYDTLTEYPRNLKFFVVAFNSGIGRAYKSINLERIGSDEVKTELFIPELF